MRGLFLASSLAVASAKRDGIDMAIEALEKQSAVVHEEGAKQAKLYEEQACTFKESMEAMKASLAENNAQFEANEGTQQVAEAKWSFLTGDKESSGTLANTKMLLLSEKEKLADETADHDKNEKQAMHEIADAAEAISLIGKAKDALLAATMEAESVQSALLQVSAKSQRKLITDFLQAAADVDPERHTSNNSEVVQMLDKLQTDVEKHKADTNTEWENRKDVHVKAMLANKKEIKRLQEQLKDDTKEMEANREEMLKMKKENHAISVAIAADEKALKAATAEAKSVKDEYDADTTTRTQELAALTAALKMMKDKFKVEKDGAVVVTAPDSGEPDEVACALDDTVVTWTLPGMPVAPGFVQKKSSSSLSFLARDERETRSSLVTQLMQDNRKMHSPMLLSVVEAVRADPLKKVRTMIQNLISRLEDESQSELRRHQECSTKETDLQDARTSLKKEVDQYESALAQAQADIASADSKLNKLAAAIAELTKTCKEANSQFLYDHALHTDVVANAKFSSTALAGVLVEMDKFFGEANQASVESGYQGDTQGGNAIVGILQGLKNGYDKEVETSTEEMAKIMTMRNNNESETKTTVSTKRGEQMGEVADKLSPGKEAFKEAGANLHTSVMAYGEKTASLIELKYESPCREKQLSKEEELENKKAEIEALKNALEVFENHGK